MRHARGISLVELLAVAGTLALLVSAAAPMFRALLLDARMTSAVNALVHTTHLARVAAQLELDDVVICRSLTTAECAPPGNWSSGWIAFVNRDRDEPPVVDPGEPILHATGAQALRHIGSNRRAYVLRPFSLRATNGTVVFCDERGARAARAVIVSYTGRPRTSRRTASGGALTCPG
jgi:type IV fimbrial biogenesis protein FimT